MNIKKYGAVFVIIASIIIIAAVVFPKALLKESLTESAESVVNEVATTVQSAKTDEYTIGDFAITYQQPELPTGCEITAMTMTLNFYGFDVDKVTMAENYLPQQELNLYYDYNGELIGNDLNNYFIGNPELNSGYVCGTGAITSAANSYLDDCGSTLNAVDMSGTDVNILYNFVRQNIPVVVLVTIDMADRVVQEGWYTENGDYVDWATNDHGAVLIGYSDDTVTIADPINGLVEYDRQQFEKVFASRGNKCVILK